MSDSKMSEIVPEEYKKRAIELSEDHVDWFFNIVRPLLLTFSQHHFRHGWEERGIADCEEEIKEFDSKETLTEERPKSDNSLIS